MPEGIDEFGSNFDAAVNAQDMALPEASFSYEGENGAPVEVELSTYLPDIMSMLSEDKVGFNSTLDSNFDKMSQEPAQETSFLDSITKGIGKLWGGATEGMTSQGKDAATLMMMKAGAGLLNYPQHKKESDAAVDRMRSQTAASNEDLTNKRRKRENMEKMGLIGFTQNTPVYQQPTVNPVKRG